MTNFYLPKFLCMKGLKGTFACRACSTSLGELKWIRQNGDWPVNEFKCDSKPPCSRFMGPWVPCFWPFLVKKSDLKYFSWIRKIIIWMFWTTVVFPTWILYSKSWAAWWRFQWPSQNYVNRACQLMILRLMLGRYCYSYKQYLLFLSRKCPSGRM